MNLLNSIIQTIFLPLFVECQYFQLEHGELTYPIKPQNFIGDSDTVDKNIYSFNINNYGINSSNDDFIIGIWVKHNGDRYTRYFVMSLNYGLVYAYFYNYIVYAEDYTLYYCQHSTQYINSWVYIYYYQSITQNLKQICITEPYKDLSIACYTIPQNNYNLFQFLQTPYSSLYYFTLNGWQGSAKSIVAKKINLKHSSAYADIQFFTTVSEEEPYVLLDLRLNERRQFLSPKDWSDSQYFIQMGSSVDVDTNDPTFILERQCLSFIGNQYLVIDDFKLYKTITIELQIKIFDNQEYVILRFRSSQSNQDLLKIYGSQNYLSYYASVKGIDYDCYLDTSIKTIIAIVELFDQVQVIFIQNNQIKCNQKNSGSLFSFSQVNQLIIGQKDIVNSQAFYLYSLRISKGIWIPISSIENSVCLYSINRCFSCLNGLIQFEDQCISQCPTNYELNTYKNQCVPQCHPTCQTCDNNDRSHCIVCDGIRINPPECKCPNGYFDDQVTPECISIMKDLTIDSGIVEIQCSSTGEQNQQINFQKQYLNAPKVVLGLLGHLDSNDNKKFYVKVDQISNTYFTMKYYCSSDKVLLKVQWTSGYSQFFLTTSQTEQTGNYQIFDTSYSSGWNYVACNFLGWDINTNNNNNYLDMKFDSLSSNQYKFTGNYLFYGIKYQFIEFRSIYFDLKYDLDVYKQESIYKIGGTYITLTVLKIPQNIPYIVLPRGFYTGNSIPPQFWMSEYKKLTFIQYKVKNFGNTKFQKLHAYAIVTGVYCKLTKLPCDYYKQLKKCNLVLNSCTCGDGQYYDSFYNVCRDCNINCFTCDLISTNCLTCYPGYNHQLIQNSTTVYKYCGCQSHQYLDTNDVCQNCDSNCKECQTQSKYCTACYTPATLDSNNHCFCSTGYISTTNGCEQCILPCLTCETTVTNCLNCQYSGQLIPTCSCPTGQVLNVNVCQQTCPNLCLSCTTQTSCNSCSSNSVYNPTSNACECQNGYFSDGISCQQCQSPCVNCTSLLNCSSCVDQTYYLSGTTCYICVSPCLQCQSSTSCLSCINNTFYILNNVCSTCISPCLTCSSSTLCSSCINNNYYLDTSQSCLSCISPCRTCQSQTHCNSCINHNYYLDSSFQCLNCISPCLTCSSNILCSSCINTYYYLDASLSCQSCVNPCLTCSSSTICISCINTLYYLSTSNSCQNCIYPCLNCLSQTQCIDCQTGYYVDSSNVCQLCTKPCLDCQTASTNCLSCVDASMTLLNGDCNCVSTQYFDLPTSLCQNCHPTCTSCTTSDHCCLANNLQQLNTTTNTCECLNGYYQNLTVCSQCVSPCNYCSSSTICLSCVNGYYLSVQSCLSCVYPCATCITTSTQCLACIYPNMIAVGMICECIPGYYYDSNLICQQCNINCLTCEIDSKNCISCKATQTLVNGKCICTDAHQYLDDYSICQECSINCITCELALDYCLSCDQTKKLTLQYGQCKCLSDEYLDNQGICQLCYKTCSTCSNGLANGCLSCIPSRTLNPKNKECECKYGYYKNDLDECEKCNVKCQTCVSDTQCLICAQNSSLTSDSTDCICDDGYFLNNKLECQQCQLPCKTCISLLECLNCLDEKREFINSKCQCKREYFENSSQQCELCSAWSGKVNDQCNHTYCGDGYLIRGEECDDGNPLSGDGCYNCLIEQDWICDSNSNCEYSPSPKMTLKFLNVTYALQYALIEFSEEVFAEKNETILSSMNIEIENLSKQDYKINPYILNNLVTLEILINFHIQDKPKLNLRIVGQIFNSKLQNIDKKNYFIFLKPTQQIEHNIIKRAEDLSFSNRIFFIATLIIASFSLILGDFEIFFETFATLQYQSLIKFINIEYPQNLLIYFQSSEVLTLKPLFRFVNLDYLIALITFKKESIKTQGKFLYYQVETDILTDLLIQYIQLVLIVLLIINRKILKTLFWFILNHHKYFIFLILIQKRISLNFMKKIHNFILSLPKFLYQFQNKFNFIKFRQLLLMNSWDALIKSFLYLSANYTISNLRTIFSISVSIFTISIYFIILLQNFTPQLIGKKNKLDKFQSIELVRTLLFTFTLTFLQNQQMTQLVFAFIVNSTQLAILIFNKKLFSYPDFIVKVIVESSVSCVILTSFIYMQDYSIYFSNDIKVILAQCQMSIMIGGVCSMFFKMIGEKFLSLKKIYCKKKVILRAKNIIFI